MRRKPYLKNIIIIIIIFSGSDGWGVSQFTGLWQGIDVSRQSQFCNIIVCVYEMSCFIMANHILV
jgi:hypothetical protein